MRTDRFRLRRVWSRIATAVACLASVLTAPASAVAQSQPNGWAIVDVGQPLSPGTASHDGSTITLTSAGRGIDGTSDEFTFLYRPIAGNVTVVAKLAPNHGTDVASQAGVMIRASLLHDAANAAVTVRGGNVGFSQRRGASETTASTANSIPGIGAAPVWLKLQRTSSELVASRSSDGVTWTTVAHITTTLPQAIYVGLASSSTGWSPALFSNVAVIGNGTLEAGFSAVDVGAPALSGGSWGVGGSFVLDAAGQGIGGDAEQFRYVYRELPGDVDLVARMGAFELSTAATRGGLVLRDNAGQGAVHVSLLVSPHGVELVSKRTATASETIVPGGVVTGPVWLRLIRRGATVDAFRSPDGIYWLHVGRQELAGESSYGGLALTSGDPARLSRAAFDSVLMSSSRRAAPQAASTRIETATPLPLPNKAIFTPSNMHDEVERYVLEIFAAGADPTTARALSVSDLGWPTVVNGECTVDVAARIGALAPGRYIATVSAVVPAVGALRSEPSPVFTR